MTPYYADDLVTLWLGDCREVTEWLAADVLVTDPPYGVGYSSGYSGQFKGSQIAGDADESVRDAALAAWGARPAAVFASHKQIPYGAPNPLPLIWDKGEAVGMGDLSWPWPPNYELIWIYGKGWAGPRDTAVLRHPSMPGNFTARLHPNQKPGALMERIIVKAPPGVIADPFAGAGSTLVAARNLGRRAVGVELDELYAEKAARRLAQGVLEAL